MLHRDWNPGVQQWLKETIGHNNFKYCKPANAAKYLRYGFKTPEDATAFKLRFG